jgi:hypothetical protein
MFSPPFGMLSREDPRIVSPIYPWSGIETMMSNHMKRICRRVSSFLPGAANVSHLAKGKCQ